MNTHLVIILTIHFITWVALCFLGPFVSSKTRSLSKAQTVVFWVIMLAWPALMLWHLMDHEKKSSRG